MAPYALIVSMGMVNSAAAEVFTVGQYTDWPNYAYTRMPMACKALAKTSWIG